MIAKSAAKRRKDIWDHSSAGRALALQARGHRFEPCWSHSSGQTEYGGVAQLARAHGSYPWCQEFESPLRYVWSPVCNDLFIACRVSFCIPGFFDAICINCIKMKQRFFSSLLSAWRISSPRKGQKLIAFEISFRFFASEVVRKGWGNYRKQS